MPGRRRRDCPTRICRGSARCRSARTTRRDGMGFAAIDVTECDNSLMTESCSFPQTLSVVPAKALGMNTSRHTPRRRGIQYAAALDILLRPRGILDRPPEPVVRPAEGRTGWRTMTDRCVPAVVLAQ